MNILILEDAPERIEWFKQTFEDCNLVFTQDVVTACNELRTNKYDLIFLDRDLSHPVENGEEVAWVMRQEQLAPNACVVIHTVNPRGQRVINRYLSDYHTNFHQIPFTNLRKMRRSDFQMG